MKAFVYNVTLKDNKNNYFLWICDKKEYEF